MLDCEKYKCEKSYPSCPKRPSKSPELWCKENFKTYYKDVNVFTDLTPLQHVFLVEQWGVWCTKYAEEFAVYQKEVAEINKIQNQLYVQFAQDLQKEFNVHESLHPVLYSIAWDQGHAYGLNEIQIHYSDLAERFSGMKVEHI